jgi:hypothetical protein
MPNDSYTQQQLAQDVTFQGRVRAALATVAFQVLEEDPATAKHDQRATFARQVIGNVTFAAQQVTPWLVERPNLRAFETSYDFARANVVTAAGDPDIESQLHTDWNYMAGIV